MKRTYPKRLGEVIDDFLKQERLDGELDQQQALALWPEIVGPGINRYTVRRTVRDGVMTVTIASAVLRNELMMHRTTLIARINQALGRDVIKEIVFN
ncbi:MAG: DUF721 domain-containing protein [Muribaculaceae bacterium]|nr:DUF721 domain-containing protein [Muribaculaceae bacterium]